MHVSYKSHVMAIIHQDYKLRYGYHDNIRCKNLNKVLLLYFYIFKPNRKQHGDVSEANSIPYIAFCRFVSSSSLSTTRVFYLTGHLIIAVQLLKDNAGRSKLSTILVVVRMDAYWAAAQCWLKYDTALPTLFIPLYQNLTYYLISLCKSLY